MNDASSRGRFVWYDLMTSDRAKAEDFYKKVAGWGTTVWEGPSPYTMWTLGGAPIGGVMNLPPNAPAHPHWLAYIAVPDVDATTSQAEALGARTVVKPTGIPTVGRYSVLADPQGALFAAFTPAGVAPGHEGQPAIGEFSWHELMTTDYSGAFTFYQALFGWDKINEHDMGPIGVYLIFGRNGQQLGGMFTKPEDNPAPPTWIQYIAVESADKAAELVASSGGTVINGPMEVPGGDRIAQCMDPQGAIFAVHSRKP